MQSAAVAVRRGHRHAPVEPHPQDAQARHRSDFQGLVAGLTVLARWHHAEDEVVFNLVSPCTSHLHPVLSNFHLQMLAVRM
jgi:hypothetical protein